MKQLRQIAPILALSLALSSCAHAVTATDVLIRVERLQDAAIAAHTNGSLPTDTARAIVFATVNIAEIVDATPNGWEATVQQAWAQAKASVPALQTGGQFAIYAAAIDAILGGP